MDEILHDYIPRFLYDYEPYEPPPFEERTRTFAINTGITIPPSVKLNDYEPETIAIHNAVFNGWF